LTPDTSPVFHVSRASIDLVDKDAASFAATQKLQHFIEDGPSSLCRGLSFFKPLGNLQGVPFGIPLDGVFLFLQRNAALALLGGGDPDIRGVLLWDHVLMFSF
jgi:hypothetical protein